MQRYILRRLLLMMPTLLGVTVLVFLLVRFLPGDVVDQMLGEYAVSIKDKQELEAKLGLDKPIPIQYATWLGGVLRGDLGESLRSERGVTWELRRRLPVSAELGLLALCVSLVIAVPVGVISALRQDTIWDHGSRAIAILMLSLPSFWIGTLVVTLPALWWGWTPPLQYTHFLDDPLTNLQIMILPAAILGMVISGTVMRLTRTQMLEVLRQDYIRTAWAKGLRERTIIIRHALKNALIPVVTVVGLQIPFLVGGTVVLESIFVIPGVGRYLLEAIQFRDYPIIQGVNLLVAVVVVVSNLVVDISYSFLDPRVRYT